MIFSSVKMGKTTGSTFGGMNTMQKRVFEVRITTGIKFTIDDGDTTISTDFGSLKATNLNDIQLSRLNDEISIQNMDYLQLRNYGGADTINANGMEINAKLYNSDNGAGKYVINDYNQSSVIRIDESITEDILGLSDWR